MIENMNLNGHKIPSLPTMPGPNDIMQTWTWKQLTEVLDLSSAQEDISKDLEGIQLLWLSVQNYSSNGWFKSHKVKVKTHWFKLYSFKTKG